MSTRVGYAGGTTASPTYHRIGDHSESVQIVFDPSVITYERLLEVFWSSHEPTVPSSSRQYMSLILVRDEGQRRAAERSKRAEEQRRGGPLATEILSDWSFTPAEGYHQKYWLRSDALLLRELSAVYRWEEDLMSSTAAARINGYLGGYGTLEELDREIDRYGLSAEAAEHLRRKVDRSPAATRSW